MALLHVLCWALIFVLRLGFPPGCSLATILKLLMPCEASTSHMQVPGIRRTFVGSNVTQTPRATKAA